MKATEEGTVPFGCYGPETCRWATKEEMRRFGLKDYPMVHLDENGNIDCYFTETEAVTIRPGYDNVISFPTNDSSLMTAKALDAYMRFRAKHESVGYALSPKFFADAIEQGCEKCFGVTFQNGRLQDDEEQPELFRRWKETH